jgi:ABC-type antimicrobial peptide transport system permease subunit
MYCVHFSPHLQASSTGSPVSARARSVIESQVLPAFPTLITNIGWISQRLRTAAGNVYAEEAVTGVGHYYAGYVKLWAVSPSLFDSTINDFLLEHETERSTSLSLSAQLYTVAGSQGILLGRYFKDLLQLRLNPGSRDASALDNSVLLSLKAVAGPALPYIVRKKPLAFLDLAPAFKMTVFPADRVFSAQDALVDFHSFLALSNGQFASIEDIPLYKCVIQLKSGYSDAELGVLRQYLALALVNENIQIWDYSNVKRGLERTNALMNIVFSSATYIAMGLCFFSLVASMFTNIYEQSKEIGILRAVGMTQWQIIRLYVHEAFVLVLAASMLGLLIGIVLGWTMSAQQQLFTQFPLTFSFPTALLVTVIVAALFFAVLSSAAPARELNKKPVASIMRTVL